MQTDRIIKGDKQDRKENEGKKTTREDCKCSFPLVKIDEKNKPVSDEGKNVRDQRANW